MAPSPAHLGSIAASHPLVVSALIAAILLAAMLVLTAVFGIQAPGPPFEIAPDPAGPALPF